MRAYSNPKRANDPHALPDVEIFYVTQKQAQDARDESVDGDEYLTESGWYHWFCFPGCLPDSDPVGPFATEAETLADAQAGCDDDDE